MATAVNLINDRNLVTKGYVGFSWTTLFFGFLVPLFRGDWKWLLIMGVAWFCSFGLASLIFCFIYNKVYTRNLMETYGYKPADEVSRQLLIRAGIIWS